ncbi:hypothetical protein C3H41_01055 [Campylobacter jejuni]|nr:hypothetical protein C3H41_01055 [Campylobacter jejuni]
MIILHKIELGSNNKLIHILKKCLFSLKLKYLCIYIILQLLIHKSLVRFKGRKIKIKELKGISNPIKFLQ